MLTGMYFATDFWPFQSSLAKKPYNPILGETFTCMWDVESSVPITQEVREVRTCVQSVGLCFSPSLFILSL